MFKIGHISYFSRCLARTRHCSTKPVPQESDIKYLGSRVKGKQYPPEAEDAPIPYLRSPASSYRAEASRRGTPRMRLWYEQYVIIGSLTVLLVYFGLLREENDIDEELSRSLYERMPGLEELQLKASLVHERNRGGDTTAITRRLEEIGLEKERQVRDEVGYDRNV